MVLIETVDEEPLNSVVVTGSRSGRASQISRQLMQQLLPSTADSTAISLQVPRIQVSASDVIQRLQDQHRQHGAYPFSDALNYDLQRRAIDAAREEMALQHDLHRRTINSSRLNSCMQFFINIFKIVALVISIGVIGVLLYLIVAQLVYGIISVMALVLQIAIVITCCFGCAAAVVHRQNENE